MKNDLPGTSKGALCDEVWNEHVCGDPLGTVEGKECPICILYDEVKWLREAVGAAAIHGIRANYGDAELAKIQDELERENKRLRALLKRATESGQLATRVYEDIVEALHGRP